MRAKGLRKPGLCKAIITGMRRIDRAADRLYCYIAPKVHLAQIGFTAVKVPLYSSATSDIIFMARHAHTLNVC